MTSSPSVGHEHSGNHGCQVVGLGEAADSGYRCRRPFPIAALGTGWNRGLAASVREEARATVREVIEYFRQHPCIVPWPDFCWAPVPGPDKT